MPKISVFIRVYLWLNIPQHILQRNRNFVGQLSDKVAHEADNRVKIIICYAAVKSLLQTGAGNLALIPLLVQHTPARIEIDASAICNESGYMHYDLPVDRVWSIPGIDLDMAFLQLHAQIRRQHTGKIILQRAGPAMLFVRLQLRFPCLCEDMRTGEILGELDRTNSNVEMSMSGYALARGGGRQQIVVNSAPRIRDTAVAKEEYKG